MANTISAQAFGVNIRQGRSMGSCQNSGPFLDPYYNTAPSISGYPKKGGHNFDNHPSGNSGGAPHLPQPPSNLHGNPRTRSVYGGFLKLGVPFGGFP